MITEQVTRAMIDKWKDLFDRFAPNMAPNRKTGAEVDGYFQVESEDTEKMTSIYDDLFVYRGLDSDDLKNYALVGQYLELSNTITQVQLADALSISDKTVSKWECGKGLPEVSLMLPLCEKLEISVNDLLSGERVTDSEYHKKAEENIMNLMRENEENKRLFTVSVICGVITIIAVLALVLIASFIKMPTAVRVLIVVFAAATACMGIGAAVILDVKAGYFECPYCNELFVPTTREYVKGSHTFTKRKLTCPKCGKTGMCKKRVTR